MQQRTIEQKPWAPGHYVTLSGAPLISRDPRACKLATETTAAILRAYILSRSN